MEQDYQEIDLLELIQIVLRRWWIIAAFMIVAVIGSAYITTSVITPMYKAQSKLFIGKETDSIAGINFSDLQIDDQLVVDYRELIKTRLVTTEVIEALNLDISVDLFISGLTIDTIKDSRFIYINYTGDNPELCADIVNQLSDSLIVQAVDIVGVKNVRIVDEALVPEKPVSPSLMMNVAIAGVLGAMLGVFLIFVLHMLDNTFKREEDVEKQLGLGVLGIVPAFEGEERGK